LIPPPFCYPYWYTERERVLLLAATPQGRSILAAAAGHDPERDALSSAGEDPERSIR
jgi:hypothetical protein